MADKTTNITSQLDNFFNLSLDLLCIASMDGYFIKLNSEWKSTLGYTLEDLKSVPFLSLIHPDDLESTKVALSRLGNEESVFNFVNRYRCADGSYKWLEWKSQPVDGLIYASARDITSQKSIELALRESEYQLKEAQRIAKIGSYTLHLNTDKWVTSDMARSIFGIDDSFKYTLANWTKLIHPEDREEMNRYFQEEVLGKGVPFNYIYRIVRPRDGEIRWIHGRGELQYEEGQIVSLVGTVQDITDRRRSEDKRRESEAKYRRLIEGLGEKHCVFSHTTEGFFLYASKSFGNLFGVSAEEIIGKDWRVLNLTAESLKAGELADNRIMTERTQQTVELECMHSDYTTHFIEVSYGPVIENGEVVRMEGLCTDITEQRFSESLLLKNQERLGEAQRLAHIGHWELDVTQDKLYWTDEIYNIFEIDKSKFGATYEAFLNTVHPDDRQMVNDAYLSSLRTKKSYEIIHRLLMKDGRVKYVNERCRTDFDNDGNALVSIGTVQDITALKESEFEQKKLLEQLNQSQKMEAIGQLAGGVAHDFNNMLGVILGNVEELLHEITEVSPHHEHIQILKEAAERSADLTKQLLAFSRQQAITPQHLDLNQTIAGMLQMLQRLIGENISINWEPTGLETPVYMDPSQINQILANLCVNARDAITEIGTVTIHTERKVCDEKYCVGHEGLMPGEYMLLSVTDTGCGIPPERIQKIFEPFFTTKDVGEGTGLGLSTVYGIMKQNDGLIDVDSKRGEGTTFTLYIPIYETHVPHEQEKMPTKPASTEVEKFTETILLVEDEQMLLKTLTKVLLRNGYEVIAANSPEEALQVAADGKQAIDLLITDVIMPNINGHDLAEGIKDLCNNEKVLFMSGYSSTIISENRVLDGTTHFIQKPFQFDDFLKKIREALHTSSGSTVSN